VTEVERIRDQLHRAFRGDAWHGPAVRELLQGVTAAQAAARPLPRAHTIWEIVLHVAAWASIVRRRIEGEEGITITPEVDWPPVVATDEGAWREALGRLEAAHADLERTVGGLGDDALDRKAAGSPSTAYVLLHGVAQHDLYHAGQIALLKKTLGARP
jgi:uncharacterized damage-inducible protein DinB